MRFIGIFGDVHSNVWVGSGDFGDEEDAQLSWEDNGISVFALSENQARQVLNELKQLLNDDNGL